MDGSRVYYDRDNDGRERARIAPPQYFAPNYDAPNALRQRPQTPPDDLPPAYYPNPTFIDRYFTCTLKQCLFALPALVIAVVLLAMLAYSIKHYHINAQLDASPRTYYLDDVIAGHLQVPPLNSSWFGDKLLQKNGKGDLVMLDVLSGTESLLFSIKYDPYRISKKQAISADGNYVLLTSRMITMDHQNYRLLSLRSSVPHRNVETVENKELAVDYATLGERGSQVAFVRSNNVFYLAGGEPIHHVAQLTDTGSETVRNGLCTYAYARDIFGHEHAMWFSPDGRHLAIGEFTVPPRDDRRRFPTIREPLDHVRLLLTDLDRVGGEQPQQWIELKPPRYIKYEKDPVLVAVGWTLRSFSEKPGVQRVVSAWQNRPQSEIFVQACSVQGKCSMIFADYKLRGWQHLPRPVLVDDESSGEMMIVTSKKTSNQSNGIMAYDARIRDEDTKYVMFQNRGERQICSAQCTVLHLMHWETRDGVLFYIGNTAGRPEDRHLFAVLTGRDIESTEHCLTCELVLSRGHTHFDASFSTYNRYLLLESLGPKVPRRDVYEWSLNVRTYRVSLRHVRTLDKFREQRDRQRSIELPLVQRYDVPLFNGTFVARVKVTYPPDAANSTTGRKYPMLVHPTDGPNTFAGTSEWGVGMDEYMASNMSVAVVRIDGRGSSGRGAAYAQAAFGRFGLAEAEDALEVVKHLLTMDGTRFDATRIGVYGVRYSGFVAGLTLAIDREHLIRCGAVLQPQIDWQNNSALYSERYMGRLVDHAEDYANASLFRWSEKIADYSLFLSHGLNVDSHRMSKGLEMHMEAMDIRLESAMFKLDRPGMFNPFEKLQKFLDRCFYDNCKLGDRQQYELLFP